MHLGRALECADRLEAALGSMNQLLAFDVGEHVWDLENPWRPGQSTHTKAWV